MFNNIKISAILIGLFFHVMSSMMSYLVIAFSLSSIINDKSKKIYAIILIVFFLLIRTLIILTTGFLTGFIAKDQPLLHGFICGFFASIFSLFVMQNSAWVAFFIYLPGILTGAWIYKKYVNRKISAN